MTHFHAEALQHYEVIEAENLVVVAAVLHAARHERHWKKRV
jgi:hypothetical protein